jgi:hypothetical protein
MEAGFLLDSSYLNLLPTLWIKGNVERSFWTLVKIRGKTKRMVRSYRCVRCGYLKSYAREEWKGLPKA